VTSRDEPLALRDARLLARLRKALTAKGYAGDAVRDTLGRVTVGAPADVVTADRALARSPLGTLVRLFVLARPAARAEAEAALDPVTLDEAVTAGLVDADGDEVRARVRLEPVGDLLIASDHAAVALGRPVGADHVLGAHLDTHRLAHLALDHDVERTFELGTGCGVVALFASRAARHVVATDVLPRALGFARFNAALNAVDNVEFRLGSFLEPVEGERFDLVLANPPYVVGPEHELTYRDGGLRGDDVSRILVQGLPAHLNEGGVAQVLVSWIHDDGDAWDAPVRAWVEGSGCDALLLRWGSEDPLGHAAAWNALVATDAAAFAAAVDRWVAYLGELGAQRIAYGAVVLRRRTGGGRFERYDAPHAQLAASAGHVRRLLEAVADGRDPPERRLGPAPSLGLQRVARVRDGGFEIERGTLALEDGLPLRVGVDGATVALVEALDGRPLGEVLAGQEVAEEHRAGFVRAAVGATERLRLLGFLHDPDRQGSDRAL
jgi:methylase of polypeptide subunit release factors